MTRPISEISLLFLANSPYTIDVTFSIKNSLKMYKKLPKIGSSKHPWLTANAKLGTPFFGNLKIQLFSSFKTWVHQSMRAPLLSVSIKITFFLNERTNERRTSSFDRAHGRKGRFAQKFHDFVHFVDFPHCFSL